MNRNQLIKIILEIRDFKNATGLKIIDTHVHPLDVMGVVHFSETRDEFVENDYFSPGILEKLNYGKLEKIGSRFFLKFFPAGVNNIIKCSCLKVSQKRILQEMDLALIDNAVLLPIEPWVSEKIIREKFLSDRFSYLTSIDIYRVKLNEIENLLKNSIIEYGTRGIKLHPNLQNFKPQPKDNTREVAEKLDKIYRFAEKEKVYILFHAGTSLFTNYINPKYGQVTERNSTNGLLNNFCDKNGNSELFEKYNVRFVLAHLGSYGIINPNYSLLKTITKKFENVNFDTAGCSANFIKNILDIIPSSKIIFGSDAIYNKMTSSLVFTYLAIKNTKSEERKESIKFNIFQNNFLNL